MNWVNVKCEHFEMIQKGRIMECLSGDDHNKLYLDLFTLIRLSWIRECCLQQQCHQQFLLNTFQPVNRNSPFCRNIIDMSHDMFSGQGLSSPYCSFSLPLSSYWFSNWTWIDLKLNFYLLIHQYAGGYLYNMQRIVWIMLVFTKIKSCYQFCLRGYFLLCNIRIFITFIKAWSSISVCV